MRVVMSTLLTLAVLALPARAQDPVIPFGDDDPAMAAAQADAAASLPKFLAEVVGADGYALSEAAVKVAIPVEPNPEGMTVEVIWVNPFGMRQGQFQGLLANEPVNLPDLKAGDVVSFTQTDIRDWSYVAPDSKLYGNYTTRVMLPHLDPAQAEQLRQVLSDQPVPPDWQN